MNPASIQHTAWLNPLQPLRSSGRLSAVCCLLVAGCATLEYAVRPVPQPVESPDVLQIERAISAAQAREFQSQGARPLVAGEQLKGFNVPAVLARLSRVTERPQLPYRALLYREAGPNAASLADGRVYISTGMLDYLARRGGREDELAFVLAHELAHTAAQHLVQRYQRISQQQMLMSIVAAGASLAPQKTGHVAMNVASLLSDVAASGYSQEQELEADQLGARYMMRAGLRPQAALNLLEAFERMETPIAFLSTHPYAGVRREYLARYLSEANVPAPRASSSATSREATQEQLRTLRSVQQQYPEGSVSWKNLQSQIEALEYLERLSK